MTASPMEFLENIPQPLYKYRVWSEPDKDQQFQRRILTDNELYLASSAQFNDPFDAALPFRYKEEQLTPDNIFLKLWKTGKESFPDLNDSELTAKAYEQQNSGRFEDGTYWKEHYEDFKKENQERFGILSLTSKNDNLLMWSHYANSHQGFCVGFDKYILWDLIQGSLSPVDYQTVFPEAGLFDDNLHFFTSLLTTKSSEWEYEQEYRFTKVDAARQVFNFPNEAVLEIILGYNMLEGDKTTIVKLAKAKYPNAAIFQSNMSLNRFGLDMIKIL
jgi:hypothetical protein